MTVRFRHEWVDVVPSPGNTIQHTMAELSIEAGGATVTSVCDRRHQIYRRHVVVPLLNVAEWLVSNWWHLWYEIADTSEQKPGFEQRHNLAFAGDGFVLPKLTMVPASERVHLRWTRWAPRHARIEFVEEAELTSTASSWKRNSERLSRLFSRSSVACLTVARPRKASTTRGRPSIPLIRMNVSLDAPPHCWD